VRNEPHFRSQQVSVLMSVTSSVGAPRESLARLFIRFVRFGVLAWGGPVAQIAMLRRSMVEEERWVTSEHFNRVLALYQVLPGPEAHEMCVYFGMLARGRVGGLLAGLGFMLPGFLLMFLLSWAYVSLGLDVHGKLAVLFAAVQGAVVALIVRAVHRIGSHVLLDKRTWIIAMVAAAAHLAGVHFGFILLGAGLAYLLPTRSPLPFAAAIGFAIAAMSLHYMTFSASTIIEVSGGNASMLMPSSLAALFWSGLKA
jgi:chromate transporter